MFRVLSVPAMHTAGTVLQILAVLFLALHLLTHPEDWRRHLVAFVAIVVVFLIATSLSGETARAIVLIGGLVAVGAALRVYDARRPNRSRTRR
jgi:hypothetical protein